MATVIPFRGILYNPQKVSGDDVFAPPYDIISPDLKRRLYGRSPFNIVRIDFGMEETDDTEDRNKYTRSREYLSEWLGQSILVRDETPSFYAYTVEYSHRGETYTLRGLVAAVHIEELGRGVHPHEATYSKPKADRLNLMRACTGNVSPIYSLYNSPARVTSRILEGYGRNPVISGRDADGALHTLHRLTEQPGIEAITEELKDKPVFIADGHHRYEVAVEYRNEMDALHGVKEGESRPWHYVMMFLANMADEGITILPTHRMINGFTEAEILSRLNPHFTVERCSLAEDMGKTMTESGRNTFGLYGRNGKEWCLLKYKGGGLDDMPPAFRDLDVVVLHELILKRDLGTVDFGYEMDMNEAMDKVRSCEYSAVFLLNPTTVGDVEKVALANLRMPPKSTYFYPKLLTGTVLYSFSTS
jgi:uncharacterized protein (DUF1015 family)